MAHHHAARTFAHVHGFIEQTDVARLSVQAVGLDQLHALEFHAGVFQNPDVREPLRPQSLPVDRILNEDRHIPGNHLHGTFVEVIEMKVRGNHGIHIQNFGERQRKIAHRAPQFRIGGTGNRRNRSLVTQPRINEKTDFAECYDRRRTSDLLKFHYNLLL